MRWFFLLQAQPLQELESRSLLFQAWQPRVRTQPGTDALLVRRCWHRGRIQNDSDTSDERNLKTFKKIFLKKNPFSFFLLLLSFLSIYPSFIQAFFNCYNTLVESVLRYPKRGRERWCIWVIFNSIHLFGVNFLQQHFMPMTLHFTNKKGVFKHLALAKRANGLLLFFMLCLLLNRKVQL